MLLLLTLACPKTPEVVEPPVVQGPPMLPAPAAPIYTPAEGTPKDPLVAWAVRERPWDETLSGAAGAIALTHIQKNAVDESTIRWALFRAGWPYGTESLRFFDGGHDAVPPELILALEQLPKEKPVGLVRARRHSGDMWVLLVGKVELPVAPFSREQALGARLQLQPSPTTAFGPITQVALSPTRHRVEGPVTLDEAGEWLVELRSGDRILLQVPLYVAEGTPTDGLFEDVDLPVSSLESAEQAGKAGLEEIRGVLGLSSLQDDQLLDGQARSGAVDFSKAGFGPGYVLTCTGSTVHGCLDDLFWSIDARVGLADPSVAFQGVGASASPAGVSLRLLLAPDA